MNTRMVLALKQALWQIWRNKTMALASLFSITAILLVLGFFFIIVININNIAAGVKDEFDYVQVYLEDTAENNYIMSQLQTLPEVDTITFVTKEEALENWKAKWGNDADLLERLKAKNVNPLPNSIVVKLANIEQAQDVVQAAKAMAGVERVNYAQEAVNKLLKITNVIQTVALILIFFLLIVSVVVVSNTVKLTVLNRSNEIVIMKYVGATNWFTRGPFLLEGMIIGIVSALISAAIIAGIYGYVVKSFGLDFMLFMSVGFVPEGFLINNLIVVFLAMGASIGACGSIISMRRFLDT